MADEEVQEVPLRHEGDEFARGGNVTEVRCLQVGTAYDRSNLFHPLVRQKQELAQEAEFVEDLEGGRMDGVAAEVAEEVLVLFNNGDLDAMAGEKIGEHDAGGAS